MDSRTKLVVQMRRKLREEKMEVISREVEKLKNVGHIKEI